MDWKSLLTIEEVAHIWGENASSVLSMIERGILKEHRDCKKIGEMWLFDANKIKNYKPQLICEDCRFFQEGESEVGLFTGCSHHFVFDDDGGLIISNDSIFAEYIAQDFCPLKETR